MIVRVPDYFSEFSCIAGDCKDSCCLGWEIDIDEDSYEYYQTLPGEVGERLRRGMYETEDGGHGIRTNNCGRCIMLNDKNLCDLYIAAGEASLSEVCTDFPRFGIEYRNVEQKCLSLACEEVCRIFFSKTKPVKFVEQELFGDSDDDQGVTEEEAAFFEEVQRELIAIVQDRTKPIGVRVDEYLDRANEYQKKLSQNDVEKHIDWLSFNDFSFEHFDIRFGIINEMELLRQVWQDFKDDMQTVLTEDDYEKRMKEYMASSDYRENDIEQLLVYFTFRYIMNAIYDSNIMVYAYLSVMFTMIVRDMNATRFYKNGGSFTIEDQMEVARIFSKEVEHSEENVDAAKELKIVVRAGAGYDNVDLEAATAHNVCVMNTPGQNSNAVAELAFGLMVMAVRNMYNGTSGTELMGKKLGIHAYGNVGRNVARIAKGFGMEIYAFDAFCPKEVIEKDGVKAVGSAEELYSTCDVVSLHIPATAETKNSINYALVNKMPKGGLLVNTARKEVINEAELIQLMEERTDLKYMTDIMPAANETFAAKFAGRYFSTPKKMGAQTAEANINAGIAAAKQIVGFLKDGCEKFRVNRK